MRLCVNGQQMDVDDSATVQDLLCSLGLNPGATVVQKNGDILDRNSYGVTRLAEGDVLELVRFVGGG